VWQLLGYHQVPANIYNERVAPNAPNSGN